MLVIFLAYSYQKDYIKLISSYMIMNQVIGRHSCNVDNYLEVTKD